MSTLTSNPLRNRQEDPGAPVCPARLERGYGLDVQKQAGAQKQTSALPSCRLRRVTEYIQQNLDKDLALADLAAVVYMSPYHFARLFRCSTGVPPHRFVIRQRIARARAFLATEDLSIAQISGMVGFRTPSHFATVFRRVLGITPGAYRTASLRDRSGGEGG